MRPWHRGDPQASELRLGTINLESLRSLSLATEGLKPEHMQDIWQSHLPTLKHLELWLANEATIVDDLAPLLSSELFPRLRLSRREISHGTKDTEATCSQMASVSLITFSFWLDRQANTLQEWDTLKLVACLMFLRTRSEQDFPSRNARTLL